MSQARTLGQWRLRSTLNVVERLNANSQSTTLAAFTPDIIPLDQITARPAEIAASYKYFISHTIDRNEDSTLIYLCARAMDATASTPPPEIDLYVAENHLVLWPQMLQRLSQQVGSARLETTTKRTVAASRPISYTPIPLPASNRHEALIAVQRTAVTLSFDELAKKVRNWIDLVDVISQSTFLAFYNVMMADPCSPHIKLTSRLEMFENEESSVDLYIGLEAVGIPEGLEACLHVTDNLKTYLSIDRRPLTIPKDFGAPFSLPAGFSGEVTLQIFNDNDEVVGISKVSSSSGQIRYL